MNYVPDWSSVTQHPVPEWFRDAKFGIYFHWGPYSVPEYFDEWYSHWMYEPGHEVNKYHIETYGPLDKFGYKDFIPLFTGEHFDADEWVELFHIAGARFIGPVTEHADGFAMWDSDLTNWNAAKMGPRRDIVGEMEKAVKKAGLKFITTLHHQWLYAWYPTMDETTDAANPAYSDLYGVPAPRSDWKMAEDAPSVNPGPEFNKRWLSRCKEVVDKYQPDLVYFDNKLNILEDETLLEFLSHYYNCGEKWGKEVVSTYKFKEFRKGAGVLDLERSRMSEVREYPWLTDDSVDWKTWCHVKTADYKSTKRLIEFLVDVVAKNGCVLLNVTPTASGVIPAPVRQRLLEMGAWLQINGEAIYNSRPWKISGEGSQVIVEGHLSEQENEEATSEEIRFTTGAGYLYAIALDWPQSGELLVKSLSTACPHLKSIRSAELLGHKGAIDWKQDERGLSVTLPENKPSPFAPTLRLTVQS